MRLEAIEGDYGDSISITWKTFLLRGEREERSMEAFTRYTESWARPASLELRTEFNQWSGASEPPTHSVPTAMAGKAAETFGREAYRAFSMGLFRAYFTDNRRISDQPVQLDVAEAAGLDRDAFACALNDEGGTLERAVWDDHREATSRDVTGVPAVIVADQWVLPGALEESQYRRIIERMLAQE